MKSGMETAFPGHLSVFIRPPEIRAWPSLAIFLSWRRMYRPFVTLEPAGPVV
jgi:hypothetical protein